MQLDTRSCPPSVRTRSPEDARSDARSRGARACPAVWLDAGERAGSRRRRLVACNAELLATLLERGELLASVG
jgi:hypothetical protein